MRFAAEDLLNALLEVTPHPTPQARRDTRGLYGLVDHHGDLRRVQRVRLFVDLLYESLLERRKDFIGR